MIWAELVIDAPEVVAEAVAAYASVLFGGVEIRERGQVLAWVAPDQAEQWIADLQTRFAGVRVQCKLRDEDEWRDVWKQYFKPLRVGKRFVVRPSWESFAPQPSDLVIEIDPGRAFGTGTHESTQLVMEAMEDLPASARFLDVGTGSGILSIAAARAWPAAYGIAIDVDPEAIACARENFERNRVTIETAVGDVSKIEGTFDLVLANIQAEVLLDLVAPLSARVGGTLILSGLLGDQANDVAARYATSGLRIDHFADRGEWRAAILKREPRSDSLPDPLPRASRSDGGTGPSPSRTRSVD
jgi:ribosomal protein L11 methyltransferase